MLEIPKQCPECESTLERVKDQLYCRNALCGASMIKRVEKFAKVVKIKGLGIKTIEKLQLFSIADIYNIDLETTSAIIGEKLAEKLVQEVEKAKTLTLDVFLSAQSIPLIGTTASRKLAAVADSINTITKELCKEAGIGEKATDNLLHWINYQYDSSLPIKITPLPKQVLPAQNGQTVCITGKHEGYTRNSLKEFLEGKGFKVTTSVTKNTNILLVPSNTASTSSKYIKAKEVGAKILTLNELEN